MHFVRISTDKFAAQDNLHGWHDWAVTHPHQAHHPHGRLEQRQPHSHAVSHLVAAVALALAAGLAASWFYLESSNAPEPLAVGGMHLDAMNMPRIADPVFLIFNRR